MEVRLTQQQSQKFVLSPQIRQYLKLLPMPIGELSQAIEAELAENPLLEEKQTAPSEDSGSSPETPAQEPSGSSPDELRLGESFENVEQMDRIFDESDASPSDRSQNPAELQRQKDFQESALTRPETLSDFLLWQTRFLDLTQDEKTIAQEIIGNIDEQGYLQASIEEMAQSTGQDPDNVKKVLKQIQQLEPPGVAARNLREALELQLTRRGIENSEEEKIAFAIIRHHFPLLEKRDYPQLARLLGRDLSEVDKAVKIITRLEPRPGRSYYAEDPIAVTPDAMVSFGESEQEIKIDILRERLPELRIHPYYRRLLRARNIDPKTRAFLQEKLQSAMNFLNAIKQRDSTLRLITEQIVKEQREFFEKGFSHLRPLRLKDIADRIGIHESTVSRALSGKYIHTPQGTIPYRSFFSSKLTTDSGQDESQKSIMEKIRGLIDKENPKKPLSDQALVRLIEADGIKIARRTVAKYRDLLRILPTHLRRKR